MKKRILIALAVLALFVIVLASCGGASCEHKWELSSTTATCTEAGEGTYVCSLCQAQEVKASPALDHDYPAEPNDLVIANCSQGGYALYICQREGCGHEEKKHETQKNPQNHNYQEERKEPTCTGTGFIKNICEWCGQEDGSYTPFPALGHTFTREDPTGISIVEPVCKVDGYVTYKCQECDLPEIVRTIADLLAEGSSDEDKALAQTLYALEHEWTVIANPDTDIVAPTCTEPGYTVFSCANNCGEKQSTAGTAAEVAPLGHTYDRVGGAINLVVTIEPTCCAEGFKVAECADCQHKATTEEYTANANLCGIVEVISHFSGKGGDDYVEVTYHAATCTEDSYWDVKCTLDENCTATSTRTGETTTDFVVATDHSWVLDTSVLTNDKPTCLTEGHWQYVCENGCGIAPAYENDLKADYDYIDKSPLDAELVKHEYTIGDYVKEPTCVSRGEYACSICKRTDIVSYEDDIDYDYHDNNEIKNIRVLEVVAPTCSSFGYTVYGCDHDEKCTEKKTVYDVAMTNHNFTPVTDDGVIECTVCSASYRNITSNVDITPEEAFCLCGNCGDTVECGGTVSSMGTTIPTAPEAIGAGYVKTLDKNIGKGIIELKGNTGTTFTVTLYNGETVIETLVVLEVTADGSGTAYLFLSDVENVTKVEITASAAATVSYYAVKEAF